LIWLDPDPTLPKYNRFLRLDEPDDPRARLCRPAKGRQSEDAEPGEGGGA
jgi:hypothetical protein